MTTAVRSLGATMSAPSGPAIWTKLRHDLEHVNNELWLVLSMVILAGLLNAMVTSQQMLLGFYTLPTVAHLHRHPDDPPPFHFER